MPFQNDFGVPAADRTAHCTPDGTPDGTAEVEPANRPASAYSHRYELTRLLTEAEWAAFRTAARDIAPLGEAAQLGEAPNPAFCGAPQSIFVIVTASAVSIRGRGVWRVDADGPSSSLSRDPLVIERRLRSGTCSTGGRPYDGAVRLGLLLLAECAPDAVRLFPAGDAADWALTASLAGRILRRPVASPITQGDVWEADGDGWRLRDALAEVIVKPIAGGILWWASIAGAVIAPMGEGAIRISSGLRGFTTPRAAMNAAVGAYEAFKANLGGIERAARAA